MVDDRSNPSAGDRWPSWVEREDTKSVAGGVVQGTITYAQVNSSSDLTGRLRDEIKALADSATTAAKQNMRSSRRWGRAHLTLGLPTAMIATVSGATALASTAGRVAAGVLALCAGAMSAAASFLGSEARAAVAEQRGAALATLATDARILAAFDVEQGPTKELRRSLVSLVDRFEAIRANDLAAAQALKMREREE